MQKQRLWSREKQRTSNFLRSYVTRQFRNYLTFIAQHIALKEEKREQQSLLDQLNIKEERHYWIHYISQTINSILELKILKRKRWSKIFNKSIHSIRIINSNHQFNGIKSIKVALGYYKHDFFFFLHDGYSIDILQLKPMMKIKILVKIKQLLCGNKTTKTSAWAKKYRGHLLLR